VQGTNLEKRQDMIQGYRLSPQQKHLWLLQQDGLILPYRAQCDVAIAGTLDRERLTAAIEQVAQRHDILRTTFHCLPGMAIPLQVPTDRKLLSIRDYDLSGLDAQEQKAKVEALWQAAELRFDVEQGPIWHLSLLTLSPSQHRLLIRLPALYADATTLKNLVNEISRAYEAEFYHEERLAEEPLQYILASEWQNELLETEEAETGKEYWSKQDISTLLTLRLPFENQSSSPTFNPRFITQNLAPDLVVKLEAIAHSVDTSVKILLLSCWQILLRRTTGESNALVAAACDGRMDEELKGALGLFAKYLPIPCQFEENLRLSDVLQRVEAAANEAYDWQECFDWEQISQTFSQTQTINQVNSAFFFPFCFEFNEYPSDPSAADVVFSIYRQFAYFDRFKLKLVCLGQTNPLVLEFHYDSNLYKTEDIQRLVGQFHTLLESVITQANAPISELEILSDTERQQLLIEFNKTKTDYPKDKCIHELFQEQVNCTPNNIAVVYENDELTYAELNRKANQLAHSLQQLGVGPDVRVGICVERSLFMVVGLLGILKAGGAYVPLDPAYPGNRLSFMVSDAQVSVLLIQEKFVDKLSGHESVVICLDKGWECLCESSCESSEADPVSTATSENLAYVIYTSGSTGTPKGVMITHQGLVNYLSWCTQAYAIADGGGAPVQSSIGFDATITSLYAPLLVGQRVVLLPEQEEIEALSAALSAPNHFSLVKLTPAHLGLLSQMLPARQAECQTRALIIGGEALFGKSLTFWQRYAPHTRLINEYGPTETVVGCCIYQVPPQTTLSGAVPIGRPIANTQLYLLDSYLKPVPMGVPGELYIGGAGVARGYFDRPDLTAQRFIPNPFGEEPGTRLYKTGDLARYRSDGNLEYLGRVDNQVKLRSFRIELGEIEAVLTQHAAVRESVVTVWEDNPDDKRLVGYVVPDLQNQTTGDSSERISQWQQVFNNTYGQSAPEPDLTFNTLGWNESYTGLPIPKPQMREWVDFTVERILSLASKRVLEIGCGTGLLLFQIAPHCSQYLGTDLSREALAHIDRHIRTSAGAWTHVTLAQQAADNFEGIPPQAFDAVILNSVIQYFPSIEYLISVLTGAVQTVAPGGFIFIGDIRSLPLLEAFHADVQLHKAPASLPIADLRQRLQTHLNEEEELIIDPAFFHALKQHLPQISRVQIQLKRGRVSNELTRFRYDVILQVGGEGDAVVAPQCLDCQQNNLTVLAVRQHLLETQPEVLVIKDVPNARVQTQVRLVKLLKQDDASATVGDLRDMLQTTPLDKGLDPEDWWALSQELPYTVSICWSEVDAGCYDVIFQPASPRLTLAPLLEETASQKPWSDYANNPLQGKLSRQLIPQLRNFLQQHLPDYMVPSALVRMKSLPLTPNGKVDRRALPAPDSDRSQLDGEFVAARDRLETGLVGIWQQVLGVEQVGVYDNFFDLGGHSLLATQVISHIRTTFGVELPLRRLFESPTVAGLAASIRERMNAPGEQQIPPIQCVSRNGSTLPLSFAQQRLWLIDRLDPGNISYNSSATIHLVGSLHVAALEQTFNEIIRRHEVLRTTFDEIDGQPFQVIAPSLTIQLPIIDLSEFPETVKPAKIQKLTTQWCQQHFDLAQGPLLRLMLLKLGQQEHILVFSIHHIASDGWSVGLFVGEVAALYEAFSQGNPSPLPELPIQYADFALWQRQWLQGEVLDTQLTYWKQQLGTNPPVLDLPSNRPRAANPTFQGADYSFVLPKPLIEALQTLSQQEGVTLFMTLLGAFKILLYSYKGQEDILVGSPIANRNQREIEGLIGFFVNTLVLRTDLSGNLSFREILQRVREVAMGAYAHQDLPFEKLVMELQPDRHLGSTPLYQVWFSLQNNPMPPLELPGLTLKLSDVDIGAVRHDLKLGLTETSAGMECLFQYKTDLFDVATIDCMAERFEQVLNTVVQQPDIQLKTLRDILAEQEKQQQLSQEKAFKAARHQKLGSIRRNRVEG
jgi:amino acid adenylation domain-containing protein